MKKCKNIALILGLVLWHILTVVLKLMPVSTTVLAVELHLDCLATPCG